MAKRYTHPTPEERYYIKARLKAGDSRAVLAQSCNVPFVQSRNVPFASVEGSCPKEWLV